MLGGAAETPYDLRFSLFGIPVRVHPLFWLMGAFLTWNTNFRYTFVGILCVFFSILVHELGHALVAKFYGWYPTIVLYLMGGYATVRNFSPWKNIAVLVAGPFSGLAVYAILEFGVIGYAINEAGWQPGQIARWVIGHLYFINLVWSLLNLVPVFPLDGGQIVFQILTMVTPRKAEKYSLLSSMFVSGIVIAMAALAIRNKTGFFGADPQFTAILFAFMAVTNYQQYNMRYGRRY